MLCETEIESQVTEAAIDSAALELGGILAALQSTIASMRSQLGCSPVQVPTAGNRRHATALAELLIESLSEDLPVDCVRLVADADDSDMLNTGNVADRVKESVLSLIKGLRCE